MGEDYNMNKISTNMSGCFSRMGVIIYIRCNKKRIDDLFDMLKQIIGSYFTLIKNKVKETFVFFYKEVSTNKETYWSPFLNYRI